MPQVEHVFYPFEATMLHRFYVGFMAFRVVQSLVFLVLFCEHFFSPSNCLFFYNIALSVFRFTASDYHFVILGSGA